MLTKKRVATATLLAGLFGSALVGSASAAHASGGYSCSNGLANIVTCNNVIAGIPVKVEIEGNRTLTGNEIGILQDNLNNSLNVTAIQNSVVSIFGGFSPAVTISDINIYRIHLCLIHFQIV